MTMRRKLTRPTKPMRADVEHPIAAAVSEFNGIVLFVTDTHEHGWYDKHTRLWSLVGEKARPLPRSTWSTYGHINISAAHHWTTCWRLFHPTRPEPILPDRPLPRLINHPLNSTDHTPLEHLAHHHGLPRTALMELVIKAGIATAELGEYYTDDQLLAKANVGPKILADLRAATAQWRSA